MMKYIYKFYMILFAAMLLLPSCEYDDTALNDRVDALEQRVAALEKLCDRINADIDALQQLVDALEDQCYVTGVEPLIENGVEVGSMIRLSNGEIIEIRNGRDGADGADGEDGIDGYVPQIGMAKDTDGRLYWTVDGKWLLDENGSKVPVQGRDGQNGQDGQDGADGANGSDGEPGADGKDGICPLLKIVDGVWYCSLGGEAGPWIELGAADGQNGADGADGDSMFSEVIDEEDQVTIVLSDGQTIVLPKTSSSIFRISTIEPVRLMEEGQNNPTFTMEVRPGMDFGKARLSYVVTPKEAAAEIAADWQHLVRYQICQVPFPRASEFYDVDVIECSADAEQGILYLTISSPEENTPLLDEEEGYLFGMLEVGNGSSEVVSSLAELPVEMMMMMFEYYCSEPVELTLPEDSGYVVYASDFSPNPTPGESSRGLMALVHPTNTATRDLLGGREDIVSFSLSYCYEIEEGAFRNASPMEYIFASDETIPLRVGAEAFADSKAVQVMMADVVSIGDRAFSGCSDLQGVGLLCPAPDLGADVFTAPFPVILVADMTYDSYAAKECWKPYLEFVMAR